jgi:L-asparagine transporter-like permease
MKSLGNKITLLSLFSIFFVYKIIVSFLLEKDTELILWSLFLIIYSISLVILYFILKKYEKKKNQTSQV